MSSNGEIKRKKTVALSNSLNFLYSDSSFDLTCTHATSANIYGLVGAVDDCLDLSYVGLPHSAGLSVRVRNVVTENKRLLAEITLCHAFNLLK